MSLVTIAVTSGTRITDLARHHDITHTYLRRTWTGSPQSITVFVLAGIPFSRRRLARQYVRRFRPYCSVSAQNCNNPCCGSYLSNVRQVTWTSLVLRFIDYSCKTSVPVVGSALLTASGWVRHAFGRLFSLTHPMPRFGAVLLPVWPPFSGLVRDATGSVVLRSVSHHTELCSVCPCV